MIDNALTTPKQGFTPTPKMSERSWAKGVLTLLKELRRRMPAGKTFTINMHWTDTTFGYAPRPKLRRNDAEIRAGRYANQVVIEGGAIDPGLHYPLSASTPWSYRRLLKFADAMAQGRHQAAVGEDLQRRSHPRPHADLWLAEAAGSRRVQRPRALGTVVAR